MQNVSLPEVMAHYPPMGEKEWDKVRAKINEQYEELYWIDRPEVMSKITIGLEVAGLALFLLGIYCYLSKNSFEIENKTFKVKELAPSIWVLASIVFAGGAVGRRFADLETREEKFARLQESLGKVSSFAEIRAQDIRYAEPILPNLFRADLLRLMSRRDFIAFEVKHGPRFRTKLPSLVETAFSADQRKTFSDE